ncbi:DUF3408 domain-containing protein [Tenacibaculum jejuense]|uniref:Conjugative transposon protein TraB n=1 Tax=Tenacibaculum jejuense TaxID=584609 RepID=A0A238U5F2_9FLAO|nr:DUF3408 domain-containing protein [Tenacibaculum jejuense]SNR14439.1 Conjugative transposon protein TraB [Tenacibaculum jejuense]
MKKDKTPIDEKELMEMMAHSFSEDRKVPKAEETKEEPQKPQPKPKSKTKQTVKTTVTSKKETKPYQEVFLQKSHLIARNGKAIYIRPEFHERLFRITRVIGENNMSISNYLDNILQHHFSEFETEIKKLFKDNFKPII